MTIMLQRKERIILKAFKDSREQCLNILDSHDKPKI